MEYYAPPDGAERMLRSRIRRCYDALAELQPAVEYLYDRRTYLNESYVVDDVNKMREMYREAARGLTDVADLGVFDEEVGVQRAQERLLTSPSAADGITRSIESVHDAAKTVIRNIEYQLDASHLESTDDVYRYIREQAIAVLGLTVVVLDAIDSGFIIDARNYKLTGR